MNAIVILTHQRPDCLWLCLESLIQARGVDKYRLIIATNDDFHPDISQVIAKCLWNKLPYQLALRPAGWLIDEANAKGFKLASDSSDSFFIEIAEDEIISRDCLEMHEYIASHFRRPETIGIAGAFAVNPFANRDHCDSLIFRSQGFTTQASLIFKEPFDQLVRPFLTSEYYANAYGEVGGYMNHKPDFFVKHFPEQQPINCGLDGLITKVMRRRHLHSFIPLSPRVSQVGFFGTHMQSNKGRYQAVLTGDLEQRVTQLRGYIETGRIKGLFGKFADEYHAIKPDHIWADLQLASEH